MDKVRTRRRKAPWYSWLPAIAILSLSVVTAAGISLLPSATAASDTGSRTVTGSIGSSITLDTTACTAGADTTFASNVNPITPVVEQGCNMSFSTNNATGGELRVYDSDAGAGTSTFCLNSVADCSLTAGPNERIDDFSGAAGTAWVGADEFGIGIEGVGGDAVAVWNVNATPLTFGDADDDWYALPNAGPGDIVGNSGGASTAGSNFDFVFAAQAGATDVVGTYEADITFTAQTV